MGIEEAILKEVREQGELEGEQKGEQKGELRAKIKGIQKALAEKITPKQITIIFEVSLDFVQKVEKGELK